MSEQLSLFGEASDSPKSISDITRHIRVLLDRDRTLQDVWVEGEISNYTRASSGHLYFSLKDESAQLKCVMWKTEAARLNFEPAHGDQILAHGKIGVYEVQGAYQLYADSLQRAGLGDLNRRFEMLKAKLDAEGLFDSERKRPLPRLPRRIGIVTSPTAAGFQDVLNILARRYPMGEVILSPALVQGNAAPPRIIAAIEALNRRHDIDVMLIIRGGGSLEDLWCFNDENVVRAVAASRIPTITGVGHEIDFTLVDFAADRRAPTPSAAAEIVTPISQGDLVYTVREMQNRITGIVRADIENTRERLSTQRRTLRLLSPQHRIQTLKQQLDDYTGRMLNAARSRLRDERQKLALLENRLHAASPQSILDRGYAIITRAGDGLRMSSVQDAAPGTSIIVQMRDGKLTSVVREREFTSQPENNKRSDSNEQS